MLLAGPFITGSVYTDTTWGQNPGRTGGAWEAVGGDGDELSWHCLHKGAWPCDRGEVWGWPGGG